MVGDALCRIGKLTEEKGIQGSLKDKSNHAAVPTAASAPAALFPAAATATTITTSSSAAFVFDLLGRNGNSEADVAGGPASAAACATRSGAG